MWFVFLWLFQGAGEEEGVDAEGASVSGSTWPRAGVSSRPMTRGRTSLFTR